MRALVPIAILLVAAGIGLGWYQRERIKTARREAARLVTYRKAADENHAMLVEMLNTLSNLQTRVGSDLITIAAIKEEVLVKVSPSALSAAKPLPRSQRERAEAVEQSWPAALVPVVPTPRPASVGTGPRDDDEPPEGMLTREQLEARRRRGPDSRSPDETDWMPPGMPVVDPLVVERYGPDDDDDVPAGMMSRAQLDAMRNKKAGGPPPERKWESKPAAQESQDKPKTNPAWPTIPATTPTRTQTFTPPPKRKTGGAGRGLSGGTEEERQIGFATRIQELTMDVGAVNDTIRLSMGAVADMVAQSERKREKALLTTMPDRAKELAMEMIDLRKAAETRVAAAQESLPAIEDAVEEAEKIQRDLNEILTRRREKAEQLRKEMERKELIASEVSGAQTLRAQNAQLIKMYEFDKALAALKELRASYQTEEGYAVLDVLIDRCSRLKALKDFMIKRLTEQPYRWGWQQSGDRRDILGADAAGVKVQGEDFAWGELGPEQVASILDHCFTDPPGLELVDVGRLRLATTVFWQEQDRVDEAREEGDKALRLAQELQDEHKKLFDDYRFLDQK